MFNLEQSIAKWRKQMLAEGVKSPVPLEELESHLREEIERQTKAGIDPQQAFEETVSQIGQARELKTEFAKDRRLMSLLETELIKKEWDVKWGPVLHLVITSGIFVFIGGMIFLRTGNVSEMTPFERLSSLAALVVFYLVSCSGYFGHKFFPVVLNKQIRLAIYVTGTVLVSLWLMFFLLRANLNLGQFTASFLWAFLVPLGAYCGLVLGLERAVHKKRIAH